jgi:hypothetical protein
VSEELTNFKDEVTNILNFGKYQTKTIVEGTPNWKGVEGEACWCYITTAGGQYEFRNYYYVNSAWRWTIFIGTT